MPRMPQKRKLVLGTNLTLAAAVRAKPKPPSPPIVIETENYRMRSLRATDAGPSLREWLKDSDMIEGLNIAAIDWTADRLQNFILSFDNKRKYMVGIFDKSNDLLIGFYTIDVNALHNTAQMTAGIGNKEYWGRNIFAETAKPLIGHLFAQRNVDKVTARVISSNRRMFFNFMNSKRFYLEARLREEILSPSGKRLDVFSFAALKSSEVAAPEPAAKRERRQPSHWRRPLRQCRALQRSR